MATNEKLLIFDFDGVLLEDTGGLSHKIFAEQVPDLALDEYLSWFDGNVHATLEENRVRVDLQRFFADYARAIADIRVRPEMRAALGMLVGSYTLAVISSNVGDTIRGYLSRSRVLAGFAHVWGQEMAGNKVEKIQRLLQTYDLPADACWFVTDTLGDLLEGRAVGVSCIGVTWGFHPRERLALGTPVAIVDTLQELCEFLLLR